MLHQSRAGLVEGIFEHAMDLGTIIGIVAGFGLIVGSIVIGGPLTMFVDVPSILIVFGGTISVALISDSLGSVLGSVKIASFAVFNKTPDVTKTIEKIAELALAARKDGILALEKMQIVDRFLAKGVRLAVDGVAPEEIRATLNAEMYSMSQRHKAGQALFKFMGAMAPAMGMIGTLIGLVQMLQSLDDPSSIGPAMAVALLTTFYGAIIANMVCLPIAEKLASRTKSESMNMLIVVEGVDAILKGENPRLIQDKLEGYLAPKQRTAPQAAKA